MLMDPVAGGMIFTQRRILGFLIPRSWIKVFNDWEIRVLVVCSLLLQILLLAMGNRRKYKSDTWTKSIIWIAYQLADFVAIYPLTILSRSDGDPNDQIYMMRSFWAPFLLVCLGGADTITAYSLEDNELWWRRLLSLLGRVLLAVFVLYKSWASTLVNYAAIPMFLAGVVKIGEKIWALRYGSRDQFRASMLQPPNAGPNYAKFTDEHFSKVSEGYDVSFTKVSAPIAVREPATITDADCSDAQLLHDAYHFLETFKKLFADLILSFQDKANSRAYFENKTSKEAFMVVAFELGLMYDLLFTKAMLYSFSGHCLKFSSLSLTMLTLMALVVFDWDRHLKIEMGITWSLLGAALFLEIYAIIILLFSDWTMLRLSKPKSMGYSIHWYSWLAAPFKKKIYEMASKLQQLHVVPGKKRWSGSMAQCNLISFCLNEKPAMWGELQKGLHIYGFLEKKRYQSSSDVSEDLHKWIFEHLLKRIPIDDSPMADATDHLRRVRIDQVLEEWQYSEFFEGSRISDDVELDQSILLWHIATDLCYYEDVRKNLVRFEDDPMLRGSKQLSQYMLYLLVMHPAMLPNGIGEIRYFDTCAEAKEFFQEREFLSKPMEACASLFRVKTGVIVPSDMKGDRSKSVLFDACRVAKHLQSLEIGKKWKVISHVWMDILCLSATLCGSNEHAQRLIDGGELLTHVWLLMAHLGLTDHFRISEGHTRAVLVCT